MTCWLLLVIFFNIVLNFTFSVLFLFPVIPPVLSVPVGGGVVNVSEGGNAELACLVEGKPRPPVLWSRANKDMPMPSGDWIVETRDGRLRFTNVTRDMAGAYRCQTAPYNGLNIKRRLGLVQLNVECEYHYLNMQNDQKYVDSFPIYVQPSYC